MPQFFNILSAVSFFFRREDWERMTLLGTAVGMALTLNDKRC